MPKILYPVGANAFVPYEAIIIDNTHLNTTLYTLYGDEPCYNYGNNRKYKAQLSLLIDELARVVLNDESNPDIERITEEVQLLKMKLEDTSYVSDNFTVQEAYYYTYKKNLETIFFLIKEWEETKKRKFIMQLGGRVIVCATGAHIQLAEIVFELTEKPTIVSWLAELRKNIVHEFAENWIEKYGVQGGNSIHVYYFCHTYAESLGWNVPGFNTIQGYSDERFKPQALCSTTQQELKDRFEKEYNYQAILDNLVVNFNLLLSPYYNIPLTPDHNTNICALLEPFTRHNLFDLSDVYSYEEDNANVWRIKPDFQVNLPKYIKRLLLKENVITTNVPKIVNAEMIPLLDSEIERLKRKYGLSDHRIQILENTVTFLRQTITKDGIDHLSEISAHITEMYLNNGLDKYSALAKIGICLLNLLMILPLGIPGAIKYTTTGRFFFSVHGKSHELLDSIHQEVSLSC